ncbi:MAG TPA: hypothetical protein VFP25_03600 [Nitrososphaeraceae archaeon]|nr:hypothetical protein [Nitrososphaeraceae archaeon]
MSFRKMKKKMSSFAALNLTKKNSFIFVLIFTTVTVIDSTIVEFSSYSGVRIPIWLNIAIFVIFSIIFLTSSPILLNYVRRIVSRDSHQAMPLGLRYFHTIISATLISTGSILLIIIFQMFVLNKYSLNLLEAQTYISYISALVFLSFLIFLFAGWLISKRNYIIMIYTVAFSLISVNLVISLIYIESYFSFSVLRDVKPYPITSYVVNLPGSPITESLSVVFDILSLSSFLLMWVATGILLSQYRHKMGRIKFFSLMSIPLIYYIFPFQNYFGDIFFLLLTSSPVIFSIIYVLIFSATKQVGALLFSLSFWTASSLVNHDRLYKSLLISSIGMVILFCSTEIAPLRSHVYPPYGLITEAFIPLGAYLLLVGIFTSAQQISQDARLRREFYKSAEIQLSLLKDIGVSQMEKEFEKKIKSLQQRSILSERSSEPHLEEEHVKEILHDVLNELYYSKK